MLNLLIDLVRFALKLYRLPAFYLRLILIFTFLSIYICIRRGSSYHVKRVNLSNDSDHYTFKNVVPAGPIKKYFELLLFKN